MFNFLRTTLHPERYHGHGKKPPFFEGWYYKLIDAQRTTALGDHPWHLPQP